MPRAAAPTVILLILSLGPGCAPTRQAREVRSLGGFLTDYTLLQPGAADESLLFYRNPDADLSVYEAILLDPVTIWLSEESAARKIPDEKLKQLVNELHAAFRRELERDYRMADSPGAGVMRLRMALTDAAPSRVALDVMSTLLPHVRLASTAKQLAYGTAAFVGEAGAEAEFLDSRSGEVLMAGVDRRVGQHSLRGVTDSWADVRHAFTHWAENIRGRLARERAAGAR